MKDTPLNRFVEEIMGVSPGYAGMGGAETAIFGVSSANNQIVHELRAAAIAFATEYVKGRPDLGALTERAQALEGALHATRLVNGVSEDKFDRLVATLHDLTDGVVKG